MLCNLGILRFVRVGAGEEGLQGDQSSSQGEHGRPGILEDADADSAGGGGDVRVIDLRDEFHLCGFEGPGIGNGNVLRWLSELYMGMRALVRREIGQTHNFKVTTFVGSVLWAPEGAAKMKWRIVYQLNVDARRQVILTVLATTAVQMGSPR